MNRYYKDSVLKSHILIRMFINDALAHPDTRGPHSAIQVLKNCVDDAYAQMMGADEHQIDLDYPDDQD